MYTEKYIQSLHERTGNDPALLERVIYAFGLLEAIKKVGLPFCFKGGTSLMLLLDQPKRLSTDIDIIVKPNTDIDYYINKAREIFPFIDAEENVRTGTNKIQKRHFRFKYRSPKNGRDVTILLDILFEDMYYESTTERPIENEFLLTEGKNLSVLIPNINSILGDKLTAFAPHTTGILFEINKELEIIKQLFDCAALFDAMNNYHEVCSSYRKIVKTELEYRGLLLSAEDVLIDTIRACMCIASRGQLYTNEYSYFKDGISRLRNHIIGGKLSCEIAGVYASKILYLTSAMLTGLESITKLTSDSLDLTQKIDLPNPKSFSYLRVVNPLAYGYIFEASKLLKGIEFTV